MPSDLDTTLLAALRTSALRLQEKDNQLKSYELVIRALESRSINHANSHRSWKLVALTTMVLWLVTFAIGTLLLIHHPT